ncbi:GntR family transcriptional regulator [Orrella sp. JC864]|uniref:GntR family transcriptional regulator n=1 Tax=Orrella sp. JC864 TaxID=3120298 RepID=UPI0012BD184E
MTPPTPVSRLELAGPPGLPKYLMLRNALAEQIDKGRWAPGERLPAEDVLVSMSGLSLGTVQRSLRLLVQEGRLMRRHGSGTFVTEQPARLGGPFQHFRFLDDAGTGLLPIYTKALRRFAVQAPGPWDQWLPREQLWCIDRLFSINREFDVFVQVYFCGERFAELREIDLEQLNGVSFKDLIARRYHQPTASYTEKMRLAPLPDPVAEAVGVAPGTPGAQMEIIAHDDLGKAIYLQHAYFPPNGRQLLIQP